MKSEGSDFSLEQAFDELHVLPHVALRGGIAPHARRAKPRYQLGTAVFVDAAAPAGEWRQRQQQRARRERAQRDDDLRLDDVDLLKQKGLARLDLVLLRITVLRRPAFDHVRNVDVFARHLEALLNDVGQQLTRAADEWNALDVFVAARRLANEHQVGARVADAEHNLPPAEPMQFAARA